MEQEPPNGGEEPADQDKQIRGQRHQRFVMGPWIFNVDRGLAIVAEQGREAASLPVLPWAQFYGLADIEDEGISLFTPQNLDHDYAMTTDLDEPVLVATVRSSGSRQHPLLIDGVHRLYKALRVGVPVLPAYVLDVEESLAIREDPFVGSPMHWQHYDTSRLPKSTDPPGGEGT